MLMLVANNYSKSKVGQLRTGHQQEMHWSNITKVQYYRIAFGVSQFQKRGSIWIQLNGGEC